MEYKYRLIGTFQVSDERRKELNCQVLRLLELCGIRKIEQMVIDNKMVKVVSVPVPDEEGIVTFDYSIFEQKQRNIASYDTNTGKLYFDAPGFQEYGLTMILIMLLQEMHSETPCYLVNGVEPTRIDGYAEIVGTLLDIFPVFEHRSRIWEMFFRCRKIKEFVNIDYTWIQKMETFTYSDKDKYLEQWMAIRTFEKEGELDPEPGFDGTKEMINNSSYSKISYFLYERMKEMVAAGRKDELERLIRNLLKAPLKDRKEMAEQDGWIGVMAKFSVRALPPYIVWPFAHANNIEFWAAWNLLNVADGYVDTETITVFSDEKEKRRKIQYPFSLYEAFHRNDQDEFLEFWDKEEPLLSSEMKRRIEEWKRDIPKTKVPDTFDMEKVLGHILCTMEHDWGCRYVDKRFVEECLVHQNEERYKKVIQYYLELVEDPLRYFPELTREQAVDWIIRRHGRKVNRNVLSAYQSLFINHAHRYDIFGF